VQVWDLADGTLRNTLTGHTGPVWAVACAEVDGRLIVITGSDDDTVRMWDMVTGGADTLFQQNGLRAIAVGPNAEIVTSIGWDLAFSHRIDRRRHGN
jgi:WD40 repeat protein